MGNAIVRVVAEQLDGDVELLLELLRLVPIEAGEWRPDWPSSSGELALTVEQLARHLVEAMGGLCACFAKLPSQDPVDWASLRARVEGASCSGVGAAVEVIAECRARVGKVLALTDDEDLVHSIPTYFVPAGEPLLTVLMGNWKHIQNHTYQLFVYLKLLGLPVSTRHLYKFKEA